MRAGSDFCGDSLRMKSHCSTAGRGCDLVSIGTFVMLTSRFWF